MLHPKEEPKSYCNEVQDAQFLGVERPKAEAATWRSLLPPALGHRQFSNSFLPSCASRIHPQRHLHRRTFQTLPIGVPRRVRSRNCRRNTRSEEHTSELQSLR